MYSMAHSTPQHMQHNDVHLLDTVDMYTVYVSQTESMADLQAD